MEEVADSYKSKALSFMKVAYSKDLEINADNLQFISDMPDAYTDSHEKDYLPVDTLKIISKTVQDIEARRVSTEAILNKIRVLQGQVDENCRVIEQVDKKIKDRDHLKHNHDLLRK